MGIILASSSPRRQELLTLAGIEYTVVPSECDEILSADMTPEEAVQCLAEQKAADVSARFPDDTIIAADTVVASEGKILGKPKNEADAFDMLSSLSGKIHTVYTGVCLMQKNKKELFFSATDVEFYALTPEEINKYIATHEPMDKAGAYGIQGKGALFVRKINGDYFNVVGLPIAETVRALRNLPINPT